MLDINISPFLSYFSPGIFFLPAHLSFLLFFLPFNESLSFSFFVRLDFTKLPRLVLSDLPSFISQIAGTLGIKGLWRPSPFTFQHISGFTFKVSLLGLDCCLEKDSNLLMCEGVGSIPGITQIIFKRNNDSKSLLEQCWHILLE